MSSVEVAIDEAARVRWLVAPGPPPTLTAVWMHDSTHDIGGDGPSEAVARAVRRALREELARVEAAHAEATRQNRERLMRFFAMEGVKVDEAADGTICAYGSLTVRPPYTSEDIVSDNARARARVAEQLRGPLR